MALVDVVAPPFLLGNLPPEFYLPGESIDWDPQLATTAAHGVLPAAVGEPIQDVEESRAINIAWAARNGHLAHLAGRVAVLPLANPYY